MDDRAMEFQADFVQGQGSPTGCLGSDFDGTLEFGPVIQPVAQIQYQRIDHFQVTVSHAGILRTLAELVQALQNLLDIILIRLFH
jgi:hypothetical protein